MAEQHPMTEAMYYILLALLKPGHGYGMMQRIRELSGGRLEMGPGTLYGVLSRMNREGWIVLTGEEGRRKTYAITEAGKPPAGRDRHRIPGRCCPPGPGPATVSRSIRPLSWSTRCCRRRRSRYLPTAARFSRPPPDV